MAKFPEASYARPVGLRRPPAVAGPPLPELPGAPVPAIVYVSGARVAETEQVGASARPLPVATRRALFATVA